MKKILFLSDFSFNVPGGAQKSMEIIMDGLSNDYEFYIIMPGPKYEYNKRYKILFLEELDSLLVNENIFKSFKILNEIYRLIKKIRPDVIHTHMVSSMSAVELLKTLGLLNCPLVYTERGVADQYSRINQFILKRLAKNFDKVITTTNINKTLYINNYLAKQDKVTVIPNTAGPLFDYYDESFKETVRKQYGLTKKVVMLNGRYAHDKNWELAKKIISFISKEYDYQFIVVIGSDKTEGVIKECKALISEIEEIAGVDNVKGFIDLSLEDLSRLYYGADIFILTSRRESFGRTAIEAMSRKVIVYGTNIDGLAEVIAYENYKYQDLEDFKAKFLELQTANLEEEKNMFHERYLENFSQEININLHKKLYSEILDT
ncbi:MULTISPECIES: glycosyltransferase family 4 protein [Priestia]|uniref:glycosyltransferase family 4 protein n=1 Tax=Priestia TaxID=2800373 RepID=UPI00240758CD|nr:MULTISPECIES: glycosyltransferase family 4 protein [Priestia]MDG0060842.1 glycosyltransferase family 4 protein [Priestia sp. P5]WDC90942.1 glycosyltransferase family 4 protein [Priestia megaterium]